MAREPTRPRYQCLVGGRWLGGDSESARFPTFNPFTQQPWADITQADERQVQAAVAAAKHAFPRWKATSGAERGRLLLRLADLLERDAARFAILETTDNGKVIRETSTQMHFAARNYRFFAGLADKIVGSAVPLDSSSMVDFVTLEPMGVCALLTAWNSPIQLLSNKLPPALAAGNTVVIKPSEFASATTVEFGHLIKEAGFPDGVVNIVTGDGTVGAALCRASDVRKISFTGGSVTGAAVMKTAADRVVPVTLELGGKSANIIFDDADLERATSGAIAGIFGAAGQSCMAGSRLLVHRSRYDQVVNELVRRSRNIILGDPLDRKTEMGPVANERQLVHILETIKAASEDGAKLLVGGSRAEGRGLEKGLFVQPTIFADVRQDMSLAQTEVFGPVLAVMPFDSEDEAVSIANDSKYGLVAGVWTTSLARAHRVARALEVGTVWVNTYRTSVPQAPAGGTKASGFGRERGWYGLLEYVQTKNVMIDIGEEARDPFTIRTT